MSSFPKYVFFTVPFITTLYGVRVKKIITAHAYTTNYNFILMKNGY